MVRVRASFVHILLVVCVGIGYEMFYSTSHAQDVDILPSYISSYRLESIKHPLQVIYLKKAKLFMPRLDDEEANISMVVLDRVVRLPHVFLPPLTEVV